MKCLSIRIFLLAIAVCFFMVGAQAQNVTYLDENYEPATAQSYAYKRIIKYKEPVMSVSIGTGYYGNMTGHSSPSGMHRCSLFDYYKNGEPALVANVLTLNLDCSAWAFDGMVIYYFKGGAIKRKEPYKAGKLQGTVIAYNENGTEKQREDYENGSLIDANKFSVSANSPFIGTWRYVEYSGGISTPELTVPPDVKSSITLTYYQNGIVDETFFNGFLTTKEKRNWKYVPKTSASGVYEEYQGEELTERGNVNWINSNQFEYTVTFSPNVTLPCLGPVITRDFGFVG